MRARSFRPRLEPLGERRLPSLTLGGTYSVADGPSAIVTADFNNDGRLDLATTHPSSNSIGVLLGAGNGTFEPASPSPIAASFPFPLGIGDFNGDGNADLVTNAISGTTGIDVYFANGDGTFQTPRRVFELPSGAYVTAAVVGDVNGDGRTDIGIDGEYPGAGDSPNPGQWPPFSWIWLGNPDGSFSQAGGSTANFPPPPARPDLNGDSYGDAVWASGSFLSVRLGRADGTFLPAIYFPTGQDISSVAVGDFNGDGRPDVATANLNSSSVSVLFNDGNWPSPDTPTIRIGDAAATEGNTGARAITFTVTLSGASSQPVTVAYATADGTAAAGSDYQALNGTLTFAPGDTTKTITIQVIGDRVPETNVTFFVNLSGATNAVIADGQGVGTVIDDEPRISISDVTKAEGKKGKTTLFTFTVTLSAAYDQPVTMSFQTANGTAATSDGDYVAKTGTLTFAPAETTKTITITVTADSRREADETFYLDLTSIGTNSMFTKNRGIGTILNDD